MNCVAKRVPATGAPGFFPQTSAFELHQQAQATTSQAYLYSINPLGADDQTDSDEEPRKQEPSAQQWKRPPERLTVGGQENNAQSDLQASHEHFDLSADESTKSPQRLSPSPSKCLVSKLEPGQPSELNSCDTSPAKSSDNGQPRCNSPESSVGAKEAESRPAPVAPTCRSATLGRSRSVVVSTRYVRPPKVDDDQLISVINWRTIPLTDEHESKQTNVGQELRLKQQSQARAFSRLHSLIASCKMLSSRHSEDAGNKKLTSADDQHQQRADQVTNDKESRKMSRADEWAKEMVGQRSAGSLSDGSAAGRKPAAGGRERVGSAISFKSAGSFHRSKPQIGKVKAPFMFAGILGSMLGSLFFSIGMLCIKLLPDGHGLAEKSMIVFCRGCIMMVLCGGTIIYQKSTFKVRRDEIWVNALRSIFGFLGVYGAYIALKYISLGDSTALVFSSPIWTSLLSHFILNEPLQWIQLLALPASLVGIILIAHPALLVNMDQHAGPIERQPVLDVVDVIEAADLLPLSNSSLNALAQLNQTLNHDLDISTSANEQFDFEHRWKGIVISLATSFIVSFVYIVLKFRKTTPIQTTTFWLGVTTALLSLFIMCFTGMGQPPSGARDWALLISVGVCSWLGQSLLQWAFAYEDASVLSVIRTLDVAMNFILSALFLDEQIMWTSVLGASIIAAVVVSIMLNSWISKKLCPTRLELEPDEQLESSYDDELSTSESRVSPASRNEKRLEEKKHLEDEITFKLEAPSLGKLRQGELAA